MELHKYEEFFYDYYITSIEIRKDEMLQRFKLNYALCQNDNEKVDVSHCLLEETRTKLSKYEGNIAEFLRVGVNEKDLFSLGDDNLQRLTINYINEYTESSFYEELMKIGDLNKLEAINFDTIIERHPCKKEMLDFIEAMALVGYYLYLVWTKEYIIKQGHPIENESSQKKQSVFLKFNNGRKLNLRERYHLIDKITGLDKIIRTKISTEKQEEVLAYILHCNPKNAQQILNGTYDSKVRETEIEEYLKSIKKE
jgi:hypothetical protein